MMKNRPPMIVSDLTICELASWDWVAMGLYSDAGIRVGEKGGAEPPWRRLIAALARGVPASLAARSEAPASGDRIGAVRRYVPRRSPTAAAKAFWTKSPAAKTPPE